MSGYARAHRGRWDHPLFKTKQEAAVWAWMTDTARFKAHSFQTRFGLVHLERGQLLLSQRSVAEDFGLGRQQVRRLMDSMVIAGMITENSTHNASRAGTIITIVNYERYQSDSGYYEVEETQGQPMGKPKANPRPTQGQPTREEREKREEGEGEGSSSSSEPIDQPGAPGSGSSTLVPDHVGSAFAAYQALRSEFVPGARPLALTAPRRVKLSARLVELGGLDAWCAVLAQIRASPFLRGEKSRDGRFVAEIDWLIEPRNMTKVLEGTYDDRSSSLTNADRSGRPQRPQSNSAASAIFAARNRLLGNGSPR